MIKLKRRDFLKMTLATAAGMMPVFSLPTGMRSATAATFAGGFKALVCVYLAGGNDAFNMFIPHSTSEYNAYAAARQHLAVAKDQILPVSPATYNDGASYGFHPNMPELHELFNQGKVATIANVGALTRPITKTEYENASIEVPAQLFSHNDQTDLWMTGHANGTTGQGWAGRMMDLFYPGAVSAPIPSPNISIAGNNLWQVGNDIRAYEVHPDGVESLYFPWHAGPSTLEQAYKDVYELGLGESSHNKIVKAHTLIQQSQMQYSETLKTALSNAPDFTRPFGTDSLHEQLAMVAKLIAVRDDLDTNIMRQVFFVQLDGWDTHAAQNANVPSGHPSLLGQLSQSLDIFYAALVELGLQNQVSTFTASEFGRSLTPNGDGTDHGWGGHSLVMGGAVAGKDIYGAMPELSITSGDAVENGRIIPTTSVDQYGATLATWFGIEQSELGTLFPNLANFDSPILGFMAT